MEDRQIVDLYWDRKEKAIEESAARYGPYLYRIAFQILGIREDAEECVNDAWMDAWNAIPPHRPEILSTFLGKIVRRIALDRLRKRRAEKRGGGEAELVLEELEECVSGEKSVEDEILEREQAAAIRRFVERLPETERKVFVCRYWYLDSVASIAERFGFSESKVASMLLRIRKKLRKQLQKEGY